MLGAGVGFVMSNRRTPFLLAHDHALRPSPNKPRPAPELHPLRLHGLGHMTSQLPTTLPIARSFACVTYVENRTTSLDRFPLATESRITPVLPQQHRPSRSSRSSPVTLQRTHFGNALSGPFSSGLFPFSGSAGLPYGECSTPRRCSCGCRPARAGGVPTVRGKRGRGARSEGRRPAARTRSVSVTSASNQTGERSKRRHTVERIAPVERVFMR